MSLIRLGLIICIIMIISGCYPLKRIEKIVEKAEFELKTLRPVDSLNTSITIDFLYQRYGEPDYRLNIPIGQNNLRSAVLIQYFSGLNPLYEKLLVPGKNTYIFENDTLVYRDIQPAKE